MQSKTLITISTFITALLTGPSLTYAINCPSGEDVVKAIKNKQKEFKSGAFAKKNYKLSSEINPGNENEDLSASLEKSQSDDTKCTFYLTKKLKGGSSIVGKATAQPK